ncbi:bacteriocin [Synechococcus sp. UW179A]|uniref:bacteriocin n=1 Tax=Synechococcus sp. UW179A TaxID=2575510 RepID=UPI000E0E66BF|nr:bacteriocin [Synechococcus sp. UW179A]
MEDPKNIKDPKKEKESPELKEELTEEELKSVDGGVLVYIAWADVGCHENDKNKA